MDKRTIFKRLHEAPGAFIIPNPWDVGSARVLAAKGFKALATTSAGMAFQMGLPEGAVPWDVTIAHCRDMVAATPLPISADLEKGMGDDPASAARSLVEAAAIGLAGCSLEDHTGDRDNPIYDFTLAVERVAAAAAAKRGLSHDFVFTARCENFLWGRPDIDDTIKRLQAFADAGADVVFAPGLRDLDQIRLVCRSVDRPVNVIMGLPGVTFGLGDLIAAGAKRISTGSALARLAYGALVRAADEMLGDETFTFAQNAIGFADLEKLIVKGAG